MLQVLLIQLVAFLVLAISDLPSVSADDTWQKDSDAPQREAYEQAEIRVVIAKDDSEVMTVPQVAQALLEQILQRVTELVRKDEDLCGKKGVYMKFGCRGDWPDLQPPDAKASVQGSAVSGAE